MKVESKRTDKRVSFGELLIGDCFIYEGEHYIKIDDFTKSPNAFGLEGNETDTFRNNTLLVTKVDAKVVIE